MTTATTPEDDLAMRLIRGVWGHVVGDADESEYERLFERFPPTGQRASDRDVAALAVELRRTHDAIAWQWADGSGYCRGATASTTSEPLKAWLDRTGMCQ